MDTSVTVGNRRAEFESGLATECIHELFEAQVRLTPNAIAVTFEGQSLTYLELDRRANQLARVLRHRGVGPGVLVGHCLGRGPEMVVGILGILKAGGAYVPLNPSDPANRLQFEFRDSGIGVLLTESRLLPSLPAHGAQVFLVDDHEAIDSCPYMSSWPRTAPSELAYVIYTSGTTGLPKGVAIPHRAVVNLLKSMRWRPGIARSDIMLAVTPLSFDIAILELLLPLTVGASCEIVGREVARDGVKLAERLTASGITVMQATPATWLMLLESGWQGNDSLKILCGGEAMTRELADRLLPRCESLWNMYGPTETTVWSTVERVEPSDGPIPLGLPIANTTVHILGPDLKPVPPGDEGELYIGGAGLARGYWNRPELTAERFIPNPFKSRRGTRLYKTGDLARRHAGGVIEFLGRADHQVKIRGHRIELGAIDSWLSRHPAVLRAVTVAHQEVLDQKRLVSYVVLRKTEREETPLATAGPLRRFLAERLEEYMLPGAFVMLDEMPLTPNGKVDRNALPAPGNDALRQEIPYVAPRDDLERNLVAAWEEVLGASPVGIEDNFFALGGHSLLALRLATKVEQACADRFAVADLIQAPTVRRLAVRLRAARLDASRSTLVEVQAGSSRPPFICLPGGTGVIDGLGALSIRHLAGLLGPDQPVITFEYPAANLCRSHTVDIEGLAKTFVRDLRERFPEGPYHIGGYSIGAYFAFEMARLLREEGYEVALFAGIDMWGLNFPAVLPRRDRWRRNLVTNLLRRLLSFIRKRPVPSGPSASVQAPDVDPAVRQFERMVDTYRKSLWSRKYNGRITLLRATEAIDMPGFCLDDPANGCLPLADKVEVLPALGDHLSLMREPNIQTLAASLKCLLDTALPACDR
ncbi:non-ribosomal peptide synthetase [Singulisphaera sp. PoT]|uniref:non-ribosomal peptide synthetase n=1 Tax=Singulisphaera sp. PoT TaxID=3411797 RepID=UPI003BF4B6E4